MSQRKKSRPRVWVDGKELDAGDFEPSTDPVWEAAAWIGRWLLDGVEIDQAHLGNLVGWYGVKVVHEGTEWWVSKDGRRLGFDEDKMTPLGVEDYQGGS